MGTIDIAYAKEHVEELLARAARGEDVRIAAPGRGTFRLTKEQTEPRPVIYGQWKGLAHIAESDLFAPLSDDELDWLAGETSP